MLTRTLRAGVTSAVLIAALALAGCAGAAPGGSTPPASAGGDDRCGQLEAQYPDDPDGVLDALPADLKENYNFHPDPVKASAWADAPAATAPVQVGYSGIPQINAFIGSLLTTLESGVADMSKDGLVKPELLTSIMPDPATMSPPEQVKGYQQLVSQGATLIFILPLSADAMIEAVDEAGKKGVITVSINNTIDSAYAINMVMNQGQEITAFFTDVLAPKGGEQNILSVRGYPGDASDTAAGLLVTQLLESCPTMSSAGEVVGNFSIAAAKTATLQFLASHPEQIDGVVQFGTMGPGVIGAFEQAGRDVPPIHFSGLQAGDAFWWAEHVAGGYSTIGSLTTGTMLGELALEAAAKTLQGDGPIINSFVFHPLRITDDTVADYVIPGTDLNSTEELPASASDITATQPLDGFFGG